MDGDHPGDRRSWWQRRGSSAHAAVAAEPEDIGAEPARAQDGLTHEERGMNTVVNTDAVVHPAVPTDEMDRRRQSG
jgi:hypothetical protein